MTDWSRVDHELLKLIIIIHITELVTRLLYVAHTSFLLQLNLLLKHNQAP
jgi:hypothetical protein